jgi:hypothetical protein
MIGMEIFILTVRHFDKTSEQQFLKMYNGAAFEVCKNASGGLSSIFMRNSTMTLDMSGRLNLVSRE